MLERLSPELENFVQALMRSSDVPEESELTLRLAAALSLFWTLMGPLRFGDDLTKRVLSSGRATPASQSRARALFVATRLAVGLDRLEGARAWGVLDVIERRREL